MAHQYSRVGFKLSVEVNEVNLSLSYGGVEDNQTIFFWGGALIDLFQLSFLLHHNEIV